MLINFNKIRVEKRDEFKNCVASCVYRHRIRWCIQTENRIVSTFLNKILLFKVICDKMKHICELWFNFQAMKMPLKMFFFYLLYRNERRTILPPELWISVLKMLPQFADVANAIIANRTFLLIEDTPKIFLDLYVTYHHLTLKI